MPEEKMSYPQILHRRTWYGIDATVNLNSEFIHQAGYGSFLVPHPAAVNWLLRHGLKPENAISLCLRHEFGHLQTVPFALLYAGMLLSASLIEGTMSWIKILALAVSTQAAWEIMSELFARFSDIEAYRAGYQGAQYPPRIIFWLSSCIAVLAGTLILVQ